MYRLRSLLIIGLCLVACVVPARPTPSLARKLAASFGVGVQSSPIPNSSPSKFPAVEGVGNLVTVSGRDGTRAKAWLKTDSANTFPDPIELGTASGQADYAATAVTRGPDGSLYYIWGNLADQAIYLRRRLPNGNFEDRRTVVRGTEFSATGFRVNINIGVATDGRIFVAWNEEGIFRYRTSTNQGVNWSGTGTVSNRTARGGSPPSFAADPNGGMVVAFGGADLSIYAAFWNGSAFVDQLVAQGVRPVLFADPTATVAPNGRVYIAWRIVNGGVQYTERQANGSWPTSNLVGGVVFGSVQIRADSQNNLHVFWISSAAGTHDMYYAFKPATGDWEGPLRSANTVYNYNARGAVTEQEKLYAHAVSEYFTGGTSVTSYYRFDGPPVGPQLSAKPHIENDAPRTNKKTVSVTFDPVAGGPDKVRYRWGAPPTSNDPQVNFATTISVPAPNLADTACQAQTLYTLVSKGSTDAKAAEQATITFDLGVQAAVRAVNPHMAGLPTTYRSNIMDAYTKPTDGASNGHPRYTRDRQFFLGINGVDDCSKLATFLVPGSVNTPAAIANGIYERVIALPGGADPGEKNVGVVVQDSIANISSTQKLLVYDPVNTDTTGTQTNTLGLPILAPGGAVTADNATNSIIRSLSFSGISVTDEIYGEGENLPVGKQFWGVWIANSPLGQNPGPDDKELTWVPIPVPSPNSSFTVKWNLFNGQNFGLAKDKAGTYTIYVRVLDGAGNASVRSMSTTVTLAPGYSLPRTLLPIVGR